MNQGFNTSTNNYGLPSSSFDAKHKFSTVASTQPDSLFRMAMLEWEAEHASSSLPQQQHQPTPIMTRRASGIFYPVDGDEGSNEHKDLSLREIINMADDTFLWEDGTSNEDALEDANHNHHTASAASSFLANHHHNMMQAQQQAAAAMVTPCSSMNVMHRMAAATTTSPSMSAMMNSGFSLPTGNNTNGFPLSRHVFANNNSAMTSTPTTTSSPPMSPKKRSRADLLQDNSSSSSSNNDHDDDDDTEGPRFRPYQSGQWYDMFHELCNYKKEHGHCLVPHTFTENLPLARWVKRQRYQYKLLQENKASSMTTERIQTLNQIGFVWDSQGAAWSERLQELQQFGLTQGHTNVPSNYGPNPQLATWVKCQRRQYKLHRDGKPSNMTVQRIQLLENIGFEWELRGGNKTKK